MTAPGSGGGGKLIVDKGRAEAETSWGVQSVQEPESGKEGGEAEERGGNQAQQSRGRRYKRGGQPK